MGIVRGALNGAQTSKKIEGLSAASIVEELSDLIRVAFDGQDAKLRLFFGGKELNKTTSKMSALGITEGSTINAQFLTSSGPASGAPMPPSPLTSQASDRASQVGGMSTPTPAATPNPSVGSTVSE